jgi:hypothetical protein
VFNANRWRTHFAQTKITPLIVATYVCHAARLQRRMGSPRTSLGPIFPNLNIWNTTLYYLFIIFYSIEHPF